MEIPMSGLEIGAAAKVKKLSLTGSMRRRLEDMGLIPGTELECLGRSFWGNMGAYLIKGAVVAIRDEDSRGVIVEVRRG